MPANLPPQYFDAEKEYREAKTIEEKIRALKKMLAVMPKHKGTDKLQADIRAKISRLQKELEAEKKGKKRGAFYYIKKEGAGQVVLVGYPNSGKTSLANSLSGTDHPVASYPFTTQMPQVSMMKYEDIHIQLIDIPPLTEEHVVYWQIELIRNSDLILMVLDLESEEVLEHYENILSILSARKINLIGKGERESNLFGPVNKRAIIAANKLDVQGAYDRLELLYGLVNKKFPVVPVSAKFGNGLEELKDLIFKELEIIRVYTKEPGKPPVLEDPLILKKGSTVLEAAEEIHKDFAEKLKYARVWGSTKFEGQRVEKHYILQDKDIVEFHI